MSTQNTNANTLILAGLLYCAYCEAAGWKSAVTGDPLPTWEQLVTNPNRETVVNCWAATAEFVATKFPVQIVPGQPMIDVSGHPTPAAEADRLAQELEDKAIRQNLSRVVDFLKNSPRKSAERTLAMCHLQSCRHWLGEDLQILGAPYPYPKGNDATQIGVDPAADTVKA